MTRLAWAACVALMAFSLGCGGSGDRATAQRTKADQGAASPGGTPISASNASSGGAPTEDRAIWELQEEIQPAPIAAEPPASLPQTASDVAPRPDPAPPKSARPLDLSAPPIPLVEAPKDPPRITKSSRSAPKARNGGATAARPAPAKAAPAPETARSQPLGGPALTNSAVSAVDPSGFAVVKVFYATNRQAEDVSPLDAQAFAGRFLLPGIFAAITAVLFGLRYFGIRSRALGGLLVLGVLLTFGWGLWAGYHALKLAETSARPGRHYGNDRGTLEMGTCEVSIPREHQVGQVEAPSIWRLEVRQNQDKHMVLKNVTQLESNTFHGELRQRVGNSPRRDAFVFVHGFNVSFEKAALRTAQIAYDLNFEGAPIFFSWPSLGGLWSYPVDKENSEWAATDIKDFLKELAQCCGAEQIHLVAHSMGNRTLTYALRSLADEIQRPLFNEVVLTAPDVDAQIFKRDIAPAIVRTAKRVTLYASSHDEALKFSKKFNGYPRAGDSGSGLVVVNGVDTIDVSAIENDLLGHSYYRSNSVLADLLELIKQAKGPDMREYLKPHSWSDGLKYWVFEPKSIAAAPAAADPTRR